MVDHIKRGRPSEDDVARDEAEDGRKLAGQAVFNPKGLGSNVFLTTMAAVVPLVIVGVASVKTMLGAKKPKR